jgi:hypothetical protein
VSAPALWYLVKSKAGEWSMVKTLEACDKRPRRGPFSFGQAVRERTRLNDEVYAAVRPKHIASEKTTGRLFG